MEKTEKTSPLTKSASPVKLRNIGKSTIYGVHPDEVDEEGKLRAYAFKPETNAAFHPEEAEKLQRLYAEKIVSLEDVQKMFDDPKPTEEGGAPVVTLAEAEAAKQIAVEEALAKAAEETDAKIAAAVEAAVKAATTPKTGKGKKDDKTAADAGKPADKTDDEILADLKAEEEAAAKAKAEAEAAKQNDGKTA